MENDINARIRGDDGVIKGSCENIIKSGYGVFIVYQE